MSNYKRAKERLDDDLFLVRYQKPESELQSLQDVQEATRDTMEALEENLQEIKEKCKSLYPQVRVS